MRVCRNARAIIGLLAAYAVALQAIVLAAAGPIAGAGALGALSICSTVHRDNSQPVPAGRADDCLAACLACCCGVPAFTAPAAAMIYMPQPASKVAAAVEIVLASRVRPIRAHRSRAPPVG